MFKKLCIAILFIGTSISVNASGFKSEDLESLKAVYVLSSMALTAGFVNFVANNATLKNWSSKISVSSGELAACSGLMGGLFTLGIATPAVNKYAWFVPIAFACYKFASSNMLSAALQHMPLLGEHLAGPDIVSTRKYLNNSQSPIYQHSSNNISNNDTNHHNANITVTPDSIGKTLFATAALTLFLYEPSKLLLNKCFNYPDCVMNLSSGLFNRATTFLSH